MALPVTVQFRPEETMLSFASRLAAANGVGRLSNLCAHLGLNLNALVQGDEVQIDRLADFGAVDARLLMDRAFRSTSDGLVWFGKERVAASAVHRRRMRACPQCLALDRDAEAGPAALPLSSLVHARRCFRHGSYLADSPSAVPNDFSASWNGHDVSGGDVGGDPAFEIWANGRLEGHRGNAWIDQLDIDVVGECSQMIGLSLLFGKSRGIKTCGQTELADAVSSGFAVLAAGPIAILTFFEDLRYGEGADQDRPQGRYGRIPDWLKRGGGSGVRFELVRAILRNHIMSTWPLGRNELALDERVIERRFHSLQSAAKELDLHPKRLGKRLEAEGHLDLSRSGPDRLIPVWVISALRDGAFEDTGLGEATEILAVSKFTIDTLLDAGVLSRAPGGEGLRPRLDRSSVMAFSSWIAALPECDGQYGRDIRSICRLFRMTAADVLHMALEGKLPAVSRLTGRSDYHAIRILPEDVEAASGGQLKPLLDLHAAAQKLDISMQLLTRIIEAGLLKTVERTPKEGVGAIPMIIETDILRFKRDHTVRKAADVTGGGHDSMTGFVAADGTDVIWAADLGLSHDTDRSIDG